MSGEGGGGASDFLMLPPITFLLTNGESGVLAATMLDELLAVVDILFHIDRSFPSDWSFFGVVMLRNIGKSCTAAAGRPVLPGEKLSDIRIDVPRYASNTAVSTSFRKR